MNKVILCGRLTKDLEVRYGQNSQTAIGRFSIAVDRGKDKDGKDKGADFINCIAFGKTAETIERYFHKGDKILVEGRIQTGSYEGKNGKVYTTDIAVERFEFVESKNRSNEPIADDPHTGFTRLTDEDIPF